MSEAKMSNADMAREFNRFDPRKYGVIDLAEWLENAKAERAETLAEIKRLYAELDEVDKLLEIDRDQWRAPERPAMRRDILERLKVRSGELLAVDVTLGLKAEEESLSARERERRIRAGVTNTEPPFEQGEEVEVYFDETWQLATVDRFEFSAGVEFSTGPSWMVHWTTKDGGVSNMYLAPDPTSIRRPKPKIDILNMPKLDVTGGMDSVKFVRKIRGGR